MTQQDPQSQPEKSRKPITVNMGKIADVFANSLYSDRRVVLRELISNANDSCVRREALDSNYQSEDFRLDIYYLGENVLVFEDTGVGMTREEIENHLSVIGDSGTAIFREQLHKRGQNALAERLIGQFGLGFLSAFAVAERIVVETKSFHQDSPAYRWTYTGDAYYELEEEIEWDKVGTRILLTLRSGAIFGDFKPLTLQKSILDFSRNVPLPIYFHLHSKTERINLLNAPWYQDTPPSAEECVAFLADVLDERRFTSAKTALGVIPVHEPNLRGVLYIPSYPPSTDQQSSRDTEGVIDIYCNRVFVHRDNLTLVPEKVAIVRGCIDCPSFSLTLNREVVKEDETFKWVQQRIKEIVVSYLTSLVKERGVSENREVYEARHSAFHQIMGLHGATLKRGALEPTDDSSESTDDYFLSVADYITLTNNKGEPVTLPQYMERAKTRKENQDVIFYSRDSQVLKQLEEVLCSNETEILNATNVDSRDFIRKYAKLHDLEDRPCEDLVRQLFTSFKPSQADAWSYVVDFYEKKLDHSNLKITVKTASFEPSSIPLLIIPGEGENSSDMPEIIRVIGMLRGVSPTGASLAGNLDNIYCKERRTVYINVRNSLMISLESFIRTKSLDQGTLHLVLHELFHNALTVAGEQIAPDHLFEYHEKILSALCNKSELAAQRLQELVSLERKLTDVSNTLGFNFKTLNSRPDEVFVIRPFRKDNQWIFNCIEEACKARNLMAVNLEVEAYAGKISEKIVRNIIECGILISDVTGANPNVMYELGAAHMLGKGDQTILISEDLETIPFDIGGFRILPCRDKAESAKLLAKIGEALDEVQCKIKPTQKNADEILQVDEA